MVSELKLSGIYVPIVTPFNDDETKSIDEKSLVELVNYLINVQKATGLVVCGTTGESPTLDHEEHQKVIEIVIDATKGRVPIIAGTGSNSTREAVDKTKKAADAGVNATLQVSPYYNRPSQEGIIAHFKKIAEASDIPIIIYNIPLRTGRNVEPKTILKLWQEVPNIIGLKDACNDNFQIEEIIKATRVANKPFYVLAGEDRNTYSTLCLGGHGGISAVAHVIGEEYLKMCNLMLGKKDKNYQYNALAIHYNTLEVVKNLFMEPNPAPVKAALYMMGVLPNDILRLPLVSMTPESKGILRQSLIKLGKINDYKH